eukprot:5553858-Pleurochrysis_carterae.AAC.1
MYGAARSHASNGLLNESTGSSLRPRARGPAACDTRQRPRRECCARACGFNVQSSRIDEAGGGVPQAARWLEELAKTLGREQRE